MVLVFQKKNLMGNFNNSQKQLKELMRSEYAFHKISKKNVEEVISSYKPPIFWKDKEVVKKQIESWSVEESQKLIYEINNIELSIKKNSSNSLNILSDFLLNKSRPSV